ncbi:MAG: hypothetical protein Q8L22_27670 [Reyranella sp.]|nr:hypothetical protein [Reyranella sp.]
MMVTALMTAANGWFFYGIELAKHPVAANVVVILFTTLGGLAFCISIRFLVRPPRALIIDSEGIVANLRRPADRVLWADLKGAHLAVVEVPVYWLGPIAIRQKWKIVALDLVDPRAFYDRRDMRRRPWLGYDTGMRPEYFPIHYEQLDTDADRLMYIINEGIARYGHAILNSSLPKTYPAFFP